MKKVLMWKGLFKWHRARRDDIHRFHYSAFGAIRGVSLLRKAKDLVQHGYPNVRMKLAPHELVMRQCSLEEVGV